LRVLTVTVKQLQYIVFISKNSWLAIRKGPSPSMLVAKTKVKKINTKMYMNLQLKVSIQRRLFATVDIG